ncbi:hypothetical protein PILCRDRAFT_656594 [Piloderma croceum F 1598]|uniref:Uncharacterized protein n=1 Tax=Piloderma croceum (strain F 1598) TaxID=765440 RepID=A0A0C3F813_PILCF|nr:hypothetical protein PILCRDRAFT_656594 [Piloderma croceum F 1598]
MNERSSLDGTKRASMTTHCLMPHSAALASNQKYCSFLAHCISFRVSSIGPPDHLTLCLTNAPKTDIISCISPCLVNMLPTIRVSRTSAMVLSPGLLIQCRLCGNSVFLSFAVFKRVSSFLLLIFVRALLITLVMSFSGNSPLVSIFLK